MILLRSRVSLVDRLLLIQERTPSQGVALRPLRPFAFTFASIWNEA